MSINLAARGSESMAEDAVALSRALINEARPKVDKDGRDFIKASLGAADTNPWQTITSLQTALSPGLSLFAAPLEFLHMMESSNASVSSNVLESLKVQVENAVGKMDEAALHTMLPATIQLIHFKELRSIPIAVMKSMATIPESCLRTLVAQDSISEFPLAVKRQAWKMDGAYYIRSIDEVLQEGTGTSGDPAARLEQHAARMCELIMDSRKLFEAFAQHCADQTTGLLQPPAVSAPSATDALVHTEKDSAIQGDVDTVSGAMPAVSSSSSVIAAQKPAVPSTGTRKYNFPGLLQRVLLGLQEGGKSVQSAEKLHDIAIILDRCKRQSRFDNAAVASIFEFFKLMIIAREAAEEKATRHRQPAAAAVQRPGLSTMRGPNNGGAGSAPRKPGSKSNIMSKLGLAMKSSAPKVKAEKVHAPVEKKKASVKRRREEVVPDEDEADTSNSDSDGEAAWYDEVSGPELKRARRVAAANANLRDLSDSSGGEERMQVTPKAAKVKKVKAEGGADSAPLQKALELAFMSMRRADPGEIFYFEITNASISGYTTICPKPMDLKKIERKLNAHRYRNAEEFDADVALMVSNCRTYRGPEHEYSKLGVALQAIWKGLYKSAGLGSKAPTPAPVPVPVSAVKKEVPFTPAAPTVLSLADLTPAMQASVQRMQGLTDTGGDGDLLSEVLAAALVFLAGADDKHIFLKPVTDRDAPNYSKLIPNKMALSNMRTKQTRRDYSSLDEFSEDVELIASNCVTYNGEASIYGQYAVAFLQKWRVFLKLAVEAWPAITTGQLRAALSAKEEEDHHRASPAGASAASNQALLQVPALEAGNGIASNGTIPDMASGTYVQGGSNIMLESILTAQDVRECVQGLDVSGPKALKAILQRVCDFLTAVDEPDEETGATFFTSPSTDLDFLNATAQPMDLGTIRLAMKRNKYRTLEDFDKDIMLMLHNVFRYYPPIDNDTYWFAEQLQYAWYLSRQNIRSVLTGDASLAVELDAAHLYVPGEEGGEEGEEEMEEDAQGAAEPVKQTQVVEVKAPEKKDRVLNALSTSTAVGSSAGKSNDARNVSPKPAAEPVIKLKIKAETPQKASAPAAIPKALKEDTAEPMEVEDVPARTTATAQKPKARAESAPESKTAAKKSSPEPQSHITTATSSSAAQGPVLEAAQEVALPAGADSLRMLRSLRAALARIRSPPVLLNGRILSAEKAATASRSQESNGSVGLPLPDLPPVPADAQLSWALVLLRDFSVQALLRKQFAMRLRDLIVSSSDVSVLTMDSKESSSVVSEGHFAPKFALPAADSLSRLLFQLCQMSLTYANRIDPVDEGVLRVYIPRLIYCVLTRKPDATAEVKKEGDKASNGTTNGTSSAAPAAAGKILAATAKAVLAEVFAQQPLEDSLAPAPGRQSCFGDAEVLRDFLESIAKHMINLKLGPQ